MSTPFTPAMKAPCERMVSETLPSLRSMVVKELLKNGMSQAEIGRKVGITRSAVNLYLKNARGQKILDKKMRATVKKIAKQLLKENKKLETCMICSAITNKKCGWDSHV